MTTYVALLRAINVSGNNAIRMAELQRICAELGLEDVRSYLQSGNLVFRTSRSNAAKLAGAINADIAQHFGFDVAVLVLPAEELNTVADSNPLWPQHGGEERMFHATFLFQPVLKRSFEALKLPLAPGESAVLAGQVVLLHCPHGYGRTKLNNGYFEKVLGVAATTRNWRTVLALQQLCNAP